MKKLTILFVVLCLAAPMFSASKTKTQYVTIDPAPLKAKPAASSKKVGSIEYASAVIVLKEEKPGYMFSLYLTKVSKAGSRLLH